MNKDRLLESFSTWLDKNFSGSSREDLEDINDEQPIAKSVDVEKQIFTAVVLRPNVVDAHGDIYKSEVVEEACHEYNTLCRKAYLQHLVKTDLAEPVESYIAPADFTLGNGEVKKGDWIMSMKIKDDELWKQCKEGVFTAFSVGCKGQVEMLDD